MIVVGLVLLVLSVLLALGVVLSNTDPTAATAFGVTLSNVTLGGFFLVGVITGAVACLALVLLLGGAARKRAKRVATRHKVRSARSEAETLAEENARLAAQLDEKNAYPDIEPTDRTRTTQG